MSRTSIARRIRRIGVLPTTYKEVEFEQLERNENGEDVVVRKTKRIPERHHRKVSPEEFATASAKIRDEAYAKRYKFRQKMKKERAASRLKK